MTAIDDIVEAVEGVTVLRGNEWGELHYLRGVVLIMRNGARWFHPYSGARPFVLAHTELPWTRAPA